MRAKAQMQKPIRPSGASQRARPDNTHAQRNGDEQTRRDGSTHAGCGCHHSHDFGAIPIHSKAPAGIQAKLAASAAGDSHEREADRVAEQVLRGPARQAASLCVNCKKREQSLQTKLSGTQAAPTVGTALEGGIRSFHGQGQPLPPSERGFFESRFGYDFGKVRVHTGAPAAAAAGALKARAFTFGRDIVFGSNQYAPGTGSGRQLLAHELTHTIQQGASIPADGGFEKFARHVLAHGGERIDRAPGEFTETQLQDYLNYLTRTDATEGNMDSDNKAREIVNVWRLGGSPYVLDAQRKRLMIREMQEGFTGDDDEQAILELLERSYNYELSQIFGPGGIGVDDLNSDFHGAEWRRLQAFYGRRFEGGMAAMLSGTITPQGYPVPLGLDIEQAAGAVSDIADIASIMMELPGAQTSWNVPCVLGILCTMDSTVVTRLQSLTVKRINRIEVTGWRFSGGSWTSSTLRPNGLANPSSGLIGILTQRPSGSSIDCDDAAEVLVHEVRHQNQPAGWIRYHREIDAYTFDEQWAIARGIPPSAAGTSHRMPGPAGGEVPNPAVIEQHVLRVYGGPNAAAGTIVVGHQPPSTSVLENPDGTPAGTRPSQQDDTYIDNSTLTLVGEQTIPSNEWDCPA